MTIQIQIHESQNWGGPRLTAATRSEAIRKAAEAIRGLTVEASAALFEEADPDYAEYVRYDRQGNVCVCDQFSYVIIAPVRPAPEKPADARKGWTK